jgi:hypothetical protein
MEKVVRITWHKMLVMIRLAIVVSLVGYTLPTAAIAMHGDVGATYAASAMVQAGPDVAAMSHAEHDRGGASHTSDNDDQNSEKQQCCADFCVNAAITVDAHQIGTARSSLSLRHVDEPPLAGLGWSLHRPPNFRA